MLSPTGLLSRSLKLVAFSASLGLGCTATNPEPAPPAQAGAGGAPGAAGGSWSGTATSASGNGAVAGGSAGTAPTNAGAGGAATGGAAAGAGGSALGGAGGSAGAATGDYCKARDGLTFCETFEAQAPGAAQSKAPWAPAINGDGTVTIDDSVAHAGGRSLKVHGSGFSTFLVLSGAMPPLRSRPPPGAAWRSLWITRSPRCKSGSTAKRFPTCTMGGRRLRHAALRLRKVRRTGERRLVRRHRRRHGPARMQLR